MRSGRPQLITPAGFDQPDNARRAAALGLGRVLPFRKVDALRLSSLLDELIRFADRATAVAHELLKSNGAAADELIRCLSAEGK
jgi:UDP:flavonoid glycosyltransferase YjiC (YdhE family)